MLRTNKPRNNRQDNNLRPLKDIIGATAAAISESYNYTTRASLDYISQIQSRDKELQSLQLKKKGKSSSYSILSLFPPPVLTVKEANVTIDTSIIDFTRDNEILARDNPGNNNLHITIKLTNEDSTTAFGKFIQHTELE